MRSPSRIRPAVNASWMTIGTEAADVFPYLCTLLNSLCSGILRVLGDRVEDPLVCLVEQEEVDVLRRQVVGLQRLPHDLLEAPHGVGEHGSPVHRRPRPPVVDLLLRYDRIGRGAVDLAEELVEDRAVLVEVVGDEPAP